MVQQDNETSLAERKGTLSVMKPDDSLLPDTVCQDTVHLFRLADGRDLAFMEWGDPDGFPVFYFHGTPGSRLEGAFADQAARRNGFRLIATDRPGFGRSSFQRHRRFADWPADVCALADGLRIGAFGVVGHSGGGPHLFACGAFIAPARLKFVGALGPWGPVATPEVQSSLNALDTAFARVARRLPVIMHAAFAPLGWSARLWPRLFFSIMKSSVSPADRLVMGNEDFLRVFRTVEREAFRQGSRGAAHEALIAYTDWGFKIDAVGVPTHIWLGVEDVFVPNAMGRYIEQTIPGVDFHWVDRAGHFCIETWDDIFSACRSHI